MLPTDPKARKDIPLFSGVTAYFPDALVEVAKVSKLGNDQHNPGQPLHWDKTKSTDHEDCIARHTTDAFKARTHGERIEHLRARAWRSLAALQVELDRAASVKTNTRLAPARTLDPLRPIHLKVRQSSAMPRWLQSTADGWEIVDDRNIVQARYQTLERAAVDYEHRS